MSTGSHMHAGQGTQPPGRFGRMAGMTLIELMVVVVVVGILAIVAVPSYRQYSMRAQRTDAQAALLAIAANQERFYLQNRTYSSNPAQLGFPDGTTERGGYALAITGANTQTYLATATPRTGGSIDMTQDTECTSLSIRADGERLATGSRPDRCW